ncbi:MAG: hypothetical protein KF805_13410 [Phycisphaeraceae bacterium]|nr:hypothetical protein [Phycisphaeraceae bacterium]
MGTHQTVIRGKTASAMLASAALCISAFAAQPPYRIVDLGTLYGESHAFAMNSISGAMPAIVGSSTISSAHFRAARFGPPASQIQNPPANAEWVAFDIAQDGRTVGVAYDLGGMTWYATLSDDLVTSELGPFVARSINQTGEVAGTTTIVSTNYGGLTLPRACRFSNGFLQVLPTLGGSSGLGLAIDDAGRVGGSAMSANDASSRPCLWIGLVPNDLGTLGGPAGQVFALRGNTAVGASAVASGILHATRWNLSEAGAVLSRVDLGSLAPSEASIAHAMNASGDAVGTSNFHACIWRGGIIADLNDLAAAPGWILETAWDIDDAGRVVGTGSLWGIPRAFLLALACPADFNGDGLVDDADFVLFVAAYNILDCADPSMPPGCPADLNADGFVDDADFVAFVAAYNQLLCP